MEQKLIEEIDDLLRYFEDFTHGKDGDRITELRGKLSQLQQKSVEVTDEMINMEAEKYSPYNRKFTALGYEGFISGAKYMRSKLTADKEKFAVDFTEWILKEGWNLFGNLDERYWKLGYDDKSTSELLTAYNEHIKTIE